MDIFHGERGSSARRARVAWGSVAAATVLLAVVGAPRRSGAQQPGHGEPDPTFGGNGRVLITFRGGVSTKASNDEAKAVAIQPDGKIIVAGTTNFPPENDELNFATVRLLPNGAFDPTFGKEGGAIQSVGAGTQDQVSSVAIQPDGKIVVAGWTTAPNNTPGDTNFALLRYNPDGSIDTAFGAGGATVTDFRQGSRDQANAVAILPDGKILAAGFTNVPNGGDDENFALVRYLPDGNVDPAFGGSTISPGRVITDFKDRSRDNARAMVVQPDGKIVLAGFTKMTTEQLFDIGLVRYNADGLVDPTFGLTGRVVTNIRGAADDARAVALQADGKVVIAGASDAPNGDFNFAIARYNPDGSLDLPFGQSTLNPGISLLNFDERSENGEVKRSTDQASAVAIQADGNIVAAGFSNAPIGVGNTNFAVARVDINGVATTGFGPNNRVLTDLENTTGDHTKNSSSDRGNAMAIQPDGKIVVVGLTDAPVANASPNYGVVRYLP